MVTVQTLKLEQELAYYRKRLKAAQERKDKDMGKVIIKCVEALYRGQGIERKIDLPKWVTE